MYILGVNSGWHDSAAALLKDGRLVALVETDRVSRQKNAMMERPAQAIAACLRHAGITLDEVETVAVGWDEPVTMAQNKEDYHPDRFAEALLPADILPHRQRPPVRFVAHHLAHAESGLWGSGFGRAAMLVVDGRGETQSTSLAAGGPDGFEWFGEMDISQSLGNFYGHAADWAGFTFWGPGKLMGLASYGRAEESMLLKVVESGYEFAGSSPSSSDVKEQSKAQRKLVFDYFASLYPFNGGDPSDIMAHANFAATIQAALEAAVFRLAEIVRDRSGCEDLVITGGVGLNCTMNGRLVRSGMFRDVYVPPVTFDTGVSLGAALAVAREAGYGGASGSLDHAYHGIEPSDSDIERALHGAGLSAPQLPDEELFNRVAAYLADGKVVGWFNGRAEIGQRALGARSMLCDPRDRRRLVRVNKVKGREVWRPLAPSVLEEYYNMLFEGPAPRIADFMLAALPVRQDARHLIPATVHVDGSARPQVVRKATNPRYWQLIETFRKLTGVPAVMNTSFNLAGEPIVHTPEDAVSSFVRSDMDVLVLGNRMVTKGVAAIGDTHEEVREMAGAT